MALHADLKRLAIVTLGTTAAAAVLMGARGALMPSARFFAPMVAALACLFVASMAAFVLAAAVRRRAHWPPITASAVRAATLLVPAVLAPLALFLWRTIDDTQPVLLDKRFLVAGYYLAVIGLPLALLVDRRSAVAATDVAVPWRRLHPVGAVLVAALLASYFYGPPWGARALGGPIESHEVVHFTGLQAMHLGHVPYVGAASEQYGPGTQLFVFNWMEHVGAFTVQGFRQAYAALHWSGVAFIAGVALLFLPAPAAALGVALAILVFPAFQQFAFQGDTFNGFWGWSNVTRYAGQVLLGLAPPYLLFERRGSTLRFALVGVAWGVTCLFAQENLVGGILIVGGLGLALMLSRSVPLAAVVRSLSALAAGAAAVFLVVLAAYFRVGEAGTFVRDYFWEVQVLSSGQENTMWTEAQPTGWHLTFLLLPAMTLACGVIALTRLHPLRIATGWSRDRAVLFGCFVAAAVMQSGALLRSDATHLVSVMVNTPILVAATATIGGAVLGIRRAAARASFGICVVVAAWALLPRGTAGPAAIGSRLASPLAARSAALRRPSAVRPTLEGASARIGHGFEDWPTSGVRDADGTREIQPVRQNIRLGDELRRVLGARSTYVARDGPDGDGHEGLWYFLAELHPFDVIFEPRGMAHFNRYARAENLRALADPARALDALVTLKPASQDSRIALDRLGPVPILYLLPYGTTSGNNREFRGNDFIVKVYIARWPVERAESERIHAGAAGGDAVAQMDLGVMHEFGRGAPRDAAQAAAWYRKAADQDYAPAQYALALLTRDAAAASALFRSAADQGLAEAQYRMGLLYEKGEGVRKDDAQAAAWYAKAAAQLVAEAQTNLGAMFHDGRGVPQNFERAKDLFGAAAAQGFARGQYALGQMYARGEFFPRNEGVAQDLILKAANQGLPEAQRWINERRH